MSPHVALTQPRNPVELTHALANALGLPKDTFKAVLTQEAKQPPRMEICMYVRDGNGQLMLEPVQAENGTDLRLAQVQFMVRLEPFA